MLLILAVALFLPLFPFSILLNGVLARLRHPLARFVVLLLWPHIGVLLLRLADQPVPGFFIAWALASSALYALRLLTVRDLGLWAGFLASSALPLTWGLADRDAGGLAMHLFALWFSLPAALLALLAGPLAKRFGAAYSGLQGGLATSVPRLSGLLVLTALAAIATPPSPGFFAMLDLLQRMNWSAMPVVLAIWLFWGWAAAKLMQGFAIGEARATPVADIGRTSALAFTGALGVFIITGLYLTGGVS